MSSGNSGSSGVSLRARLYAAALIVVAVAMAASWIGLTALFTRHLERRVGGELNTHLSQLAGSVEIAADGTLSLLREPADPRFGRVGGGLYWEIAQGRVGGKFLASRSLWDERLALPAGVPDPGGIHVHDIRTKAGDSLLAHERVIVAPDASGRDRMLVIAAAIDRSEIEQLRTGFGRDLAPALLLLGFVLFGGFALQVEAGLRPLAPLRRKIAAIRSGSTSRLDTAVPIEISPLAEEINSLLEQREREVMRARDRAADLAHGLKTPLAALASDIARLRGKGENSIADQIAEVAETMRRQIERELVRARIRHNAMPSSAVLPAAEAIARTLARTPDAEGKGFDLAIAKDFSLRIDPQDLAEALGNLMENAIRHARTTVRLSGEVGDDSAVLHIEDDGAGMSEALMSAAQQRGTRLDMAGGSAGLGLAIAGEIVSACGGTLLLGNSSLGGLKASIALPIVEAIRG